MQENERIPYSILRFSCFPILSYKDGNGSDSTCLGFRTPENYLVWWNDPKNTVRNLETGPDSACLGFRLEIISEQYYMTKYPKNTLCCLKDYIQPLLLSDIGAIQSKPTVMMHTKDVEQS